MAAVADGEACAGAGDDTEAFGDVVGAGGAEEAGGGEAAARRPVSNLVRLLLSVIIEDGATRTN